MLKIFISYRHGDTDAWARLMFDRLRFAFGQENVFMDVDTIDPGDDWVDKLENAVGACDVLIAVIGKGWINVTDPDGRRRLEEPHDWVRTEVAAGLNRNVRVIPVLVDDAKMPRQEDLPRELAPLARRHAMEIRNAAFNADMDRLIQAIKKTKARLQALSAREDGTIQLWDSEGGTCLKTLAGHTLSVMGVSMTRDGRRAVSGSADKTLRIWDLEAGVCLKTLTGHTDWVRDVSIAADGRRAVSGSDDKTVRLWDLETGKCLSTLAGHTGPVLSVCMGRDGRKAVSGSSDETVRVWDLATGECVGILKGQAGPVLSVSIGA